MSTISGKDSKDGSAKPEAASHTSATTGSDQKSQTRLVQPSGSLKRNAVAADLDVVSEHRELAPNKRTSLSNVAQVSVESASLVSLNQHLSEAMAVQAVVQSALNATNALVTKLQADKQRLIELESIQAIDRERERKAWREEKATMEADMSHLLAQHTTLQTTHVLITKAYAESEANVAVNMQQIASLRNALNARASISPAPRPLTFSPPSSDRAQSRSLAPASSPVQHAIQHHDSKPDLKENTTTSHLTNSDEALSKSSSEEARDAALDSLRQNHADPTPLLTSAPVTPLVKSMPAHVQLDNTVIKSAHPEDVILTQNTSMSGLPKSSTPMRNQSTPIFTPVDNTTSPSSNSTLKAIDLVRPKVINRLCRAPDASSGATPGQHRPPYFLVHYGDSENPYYARYLVKSDRRRTTHLEVRFISEDAKTVTWTAIEASALRLISVPAQCSKVCVYLVEASHLFGHLCRVSLVKHESRQVSVTVLNRSPKITVPFSPAGLFALAHIPVAGE